MDLIAKAMFKVQTTILCKTIRDRFHNGHTRRKKPPLACYLTI